ncbi:MAG: DUF1343 domain-containing protein, partial [Bacteroidota bacterium]
SSPWSNWIDTQYEASSETKPFFRKGFQRWPGNTSFQQQIVAGESPEAIWQSWQEGVAAFKQMRKAYLLYPDFE